MSKSAQSADSTTLPAMNNGFAAMLAVALGLALVVALAASGFVASGAQDNGVVFVGPARVDQGLALDTAQLVAGALPAPGATTVFAQAPHQIVMPDGTPLPLRRWGPAPETGEWPQAVVLGVHGLNDHAGSFVATAEALAPNGVAVYAWDQRGFGASRERGEWPGVDALVADAHFAARALRQRYPDTPLYLMGISMGAAVVLVAADAQNPLPVDGTVLVGPAVWGEVAMPWYQRWGLWIGERLAPELSFNAQAVGIHPTDREAVLDRLAKDPLWIRQTSIEVMAGVADLMDKALKGLPDFAGPMTLIQYGGQDEIIPPEAACAMFRRLPPQAPWRAAFYPTGFHMLTRSSVGSTVLADIMAFIEARDAMLPSGHGMSRQDMLAAVCGD
mgnify:CR=1 FL=1